MSRQGKEYLQELVDAVVCIPGAFRIKCGNGKYLFAVTTSDQETTDYFAVLQGVILLVQTNQSVLGGTKGLGSDWYGVDPRVTMLNQSSHEESWLLFYTRKEIL